MATAKSNFLQSTQEQRVASFFNNASIHVPNKFVVGFWGDYVTSAIQYLSDYSVTDPRLNVPKRVDQINLYSDILYRWLSIHCPEYQQSNQSTSINPRNTIKPITAVELLWACESITFPGSVSPKFNTEMTLDTYKTIPYPVITGHNGPGEVRLTITEDRTLMFYQFFNAMMNQFFDPLTMKPRNSFQKLGMYVIVIDGYDTPNKYGYKRDYVTKDDNGNDYFVVQDVPLQVFEFNAVVLSDIGTLKYGNSSDAKSATFDVTLKAPNLFQDAFKTTGNFRGLEDNTSDSKLTSGLKYNASMFEEPTSVSKKPTATGSAVTGMSGPGQGARFGVSGNGSTGSSGGSW